MNAQPSHRHGSLTCLLLLAMAQALSVPSHAEAIDVAVESPVRDRAIRLRSGVLEGPGDETRPVGNCLGDPKSCERGGPVLLKLRAPADDGFRAAARSAGVRLSAYVGGDTFIVYLPADRLDAAMALPGYDWSTPYHPEMRISHSLMNLDVSPPDRTLPVVVYIDPDADAEAVGRRARRSGLDVREVAQGRPRSADRAARWGRIVVDTKPDVWAGVRTAVADWPETLWVDRVPVYGWHNDSSSWVIQSGIGNELATPLYDRGLFGDGEIVGILDSGLDADSCFFRDDVHGLPATNLGTGVGSPDPTHRKILQYNFLWSLDNPNDPADWDDYGHGTHTAGSLAGDRPDSLGTRDHADGMAPAAKMIVQDTGYLPNPPSGCSDIPAFGCPTQDLYPFYEQARLQGARIHSNSYGDGGVVPINLYTAEGSSAADAAMWDYPDYLMVFSAGNGGPGLGTVTNPGTAKNSISVGATTYGASADTLASFSGRGPTLDGRFKPDLTAPGLGIVSSSSDGNVETNNCTTLVSSGTSMACPSVAGLAALVREYFVKGFYPSGSARAQDGLSPSGALLKATLIASAAPMANVTGFVPSNLQGWGRPVADDALYFAGDGARLRIADVASRFVTAGDEDTHTIRVLDDSEPLRVVVAWTDYPSNPVAAVNLVNDLDLEVESPSGTIYRGNVFVDGQSSAGGLPDRLNNLEVVRVAAPEPGTWTVRVAAFAVPQAPQGYALVVTGRLPAPGVTLEVASLVIDDSAGGNHDGIADPGEWIDLPLTVLNAGDTDAIDVVVRWQSLTPGVEVIRSESPLPDLSPGQAAATAAPHPRIRLSVDHACSEPVLLELTLLAAGYETSQEQPFDTGSRSVFLREDFESSTDWTLSAGESTAARGHWGVGDPEGTGFQPEADVTPDPASRCLFTAPNPDRGIGTDDVDGGVTVARSGILDLSGHDEARLSVHRWWGHRDVGEDVNDYFRMEIRADSTSPHVLLEQLDYTQNLPHWFERVFRVADFVSPGPEVELRVSASDGFGPGSVIEAAIDEVVFWDPICVPHQPVPNPVETLRVDRQADDLVLTWQAPPVEPSHGEADLYLVYRSTSPSSGFVEIDSIEGGAANPSAIDPGATGGAEDLFYLVIASNGSGSADLLP